MLICGEHHDRRIIGDVLPLAEGRQIIAAVREVVDSQPMGRGTVQLLSGSNGSSRSPIRGS
jgi:hypothetical protein